MVSLRPTLKPSVRTGDIMMATKTVNYSFWIGLGKTVKNSAFMLIPFGLALLATVPAEYAWLAGPVVYMLKNYYYNKNK